MRPLGVGVLTIRSYTRNLIVYWDVWLLHILLNGYLTHIFFVIRILFQL